MDPHLWLSVSVEHCARGHIHVHQLLHIFLLALKYEKTCGMDEQARNAVWCYLGKKKFSPVPYMKNDSTRRTEQQKIFILFYFWLEINKTQGGKMQTGRREIKSLKLCSKVGSCPSRSS